MKFALFAIVVLATAATVSCDGFFSGFHDLEFPDLKFPDIKIPDITKVKPAPGQSFLGMVATASSVNGKDSGLVVTNQNGNVKAFKLGDHEKD